MIILPACAVVSAAQGSEIGLETGTANRFHQSRANSRGAMAATTLRESDSYLGAQFRRFRTRPGPPVATRAMAAKLARLIYRMLRYGMKYTNQGAKLYDAQYRKQHVSYLKRKAAQLKRVAKPAASTTSFSGR